MKFEGTYIRFVAILSLLILFVSSCQDNQKKQRPDFSVPGGFMPEEFENRGPDIEFANKLPESLKCGPPETYVLNLSLNETVNNCTNVDFGGLYQTAINIVNRRVNKLVCPENCRPLKKSEIARMWRCNDEIRKAVLRLKFRMVCSKTGADISEGLAEPTIDDFGNNPYSKGEVQPVQDGDEVITVDADTSGVMGGHVCPSNTYNYVKYFETVESCSGINYEPYVRKAEKRAEILYDLQTCSNPCTKQPLMITNRKWDCKGAHTVDVDVFYALICGESH